MNTAMPEVIHSDLYEQILEKNDKSVASHVAMGHHTRVSADCAVGDCQLGTPVNYFTTDRTILIKGGVKPKPKSKQFKT